MSFPVVDRLKNFPSTSLPEKVKIYEVGPRDGLQNEKELISVENKVSFITDLLAAGLEVVELTSFVSPKWVPQLADASQVLSKLPGDVVANMPVLIPNLKGYELAKAHHVGHIAVFASATEAFAKNNLNSTYEDQFLAIEAVASKAQSDKMHIRGYVSMCFGDPWEIEVNQEVVVETVKRLLDLGTYEVSLGDTIGVATPGQVSSLLVALEKAGVPLDKIAVHFHDTYGQALSNSLTSLSHGIKTFDASAGGIGGCPYAPNAAGNLATEDLVWMLHGMGIQTGVNLEKLLEASSKLNKALNRPSSSRVLKALKGN